MGKTPDELAGKFDSFMWEWAHHNVVRDQKEQDTLLFSLVDVMTTWMQPEIKQKMKDREEQQKQWPAAEEYFEELRRQGASEEYIAKERAELQQDDGDTMEVIRGPNA